MKKFSIACLLCFASLSLTSCFSFLSDDLNNETNLPSIGEWAEAGNYKFKVVSVENTKKIKSSYTEYTTQNNFMCILVELKNDSAYSHRFSYTDFKVYKGETKYTSKGTEAYYYSESKGDYPSLYLADSIDASLGGKYYLVYETPTTNLEDEYELEYYCGDKARVKLSGSEGDSTVTPSGEVTFEQLESLASQVPANPYNRLMVSQTATVTSGGQQQSQSYTEYWSYSGGSWTLTSYYPDVSGLDINNTELNYFIYYLSSDQKAKCVASVDPFKIVSTGMRSVMDSSLMENATYIWNRYGFIESINMEMYNPSNTSARATWAISTYYYNA